MWSRLIGIFVLSFIMLFPFNSYAAPNNGGDNAGVQNACEVSGGTFTGSEGGNWACCWADWGCYGCVDGNCKIKCNTARCRKANSMKAPNTSETKVKGLAPAGMAAPIAPKLSKKVMNKKTQ